MTISRGQLPFSIASSSATDGYVSDVATNFKSGVDITNNHQDLVGNYENEPLQGPFTSEHVGGNQHRHTPLNQGEDTAANRAEAYVIKFQSGDMYLYGPEQYNTPRASMLRGNGAKSPLNIRNIGTSGSILGNYNFNYEVVQTVGRKENNRFLTKNPDLTLTVATSSYIYGIADRNLPDRSLNGSNDSIIVNRFNAPGGADVSSRGVLDVESEEYAVNNSLPFRNLVVRRPLNLLNTQHAGPFGYSSFEEDTGSWYTTEPSASFNKINRNTSYRRDDTDAPVEKHDNWFIQHAIPQSDLQYSWITASTETNKYDLAGYQRSGSYSNAGGAFTDINFVSSSEGVDFVGIDSSNKEWELVVVSTNKIVDENFESYAISASSLGDKWETDGSSEIRKDSVKMNKAFVFNSDVGTERYIKYKNTIQGQSIIELEVIDGTYNPLDLEKTDSGENLILQYSFDGTNWTTSSVLVDATPGLTGYTKIRYQVDISSSLVGDSGLRPYYVKICQPNFTGLDNDNYAINSITIREIRKDLHLEGEGENVLIRRGATGSLSIHNGPYGWPTWKQIRTGEHPVARMMRKNNIISVQNDPVEKTVVSNGQIRTFKGKRGEGSENYKEPPVTNKHKPMEHYVLLKGNTDPLLGHKITHTYANNLSLYANKELDKKIGITKNNEQVLDQINRFISDPDFPEEENPINKLLSYKQTETIWPKEKNTFLSRTRGREKYILDMPGYSDDGYDRNTSELRSLWRSDVSIRDRTPPYTSGILDVNGRPTSGSVLNKAPAINSQGKQISGSVISYYTANQVDYTASWGGRSRLPIDKLGKMHRAFDYVDIQVSSQYGGELNALYLWITNPSATKALWVESGFSGEEAAAAVGGPLYPKGGFITARAKYCAFLDSYFDVSADGFPTPNFQYAHDSGLDYEVADMAGRGPFYSSYEEYSEDIKRFGKDYSLIPEFSISDFMKFYVDENGGNFRKNNKSYLQIDGILLRTSGSANLSTSSYDDDFFNQYVHTDFINIKKSKQEQINRISITCSGIKKLLPYNGFYPIERTLQLASLLSQSYANNIRDDVRVSGYKQAKAVLLQPFYGPGIMYNTIKSGIAVDFPLYTGSDAGASNYGYSPADDFVNNGFGYDSQRGHFILSASANYRLPFESIIKPEIGIPLSSSVNPDEGKVYYTSVGGNMAYWTDIPYFKYDRTNVHSPLYSLAASNFFGETVKFFLKNEKLKSFASQPQNKWKTFQSGTSYYMDVILRKTEDLVMMEAHHGTYYETGRFGEKMHGRYFGWPVNKYDGGLPYGTSSYRDAYTDPAYAPYTPPYFESDAILRLSFTPTSSKKYELDEIFSSCEVENIYPKILRYTGSSAYDSAMSISASIEVFGKSRQKLVDFDLSKANSKASLVKDSESKEGDVWVIGTKMETPVLDFSKQTIKSHDVVETTMVTLSGSGFGRGMWSGYGEIPTSSNGIYFEIAESFPQAYKSPLYPNTGSLLKQVGFIPSSEKIGQIAESKEISEAVVVIPYLENKTNNTTEINCHHFIKIDRDIFNRQRQNVENGDSAIKQGDFGSKIEYRDTSISKMIKSMKEYVIPPSMNFLEYSDIDPFIMYVLEFKHTLDQQDLVDIWQGVMPKIAMTAEKDQIEINHPTGKFEFFGEGEMPEKLKFMVFKVKKKAENNYYAVTADSTDDERFKFDFQIGRKAPEYSYNWPYDFFSLVELAKVDVSLEYAPNDSEQKLIEKSPQILSTVLNDKSSKKINKRGTKVKGSKIR